MKKTVLLLSILFFSYQAYAQFHTLNIPKASQPVEETQKLGVTQITVKYSSPATKGRDVWNTIIPYDGQPLPWRAGADMNTEIYFSTDVTIEGQALKAGTYGFHILPHKDGTHTLLFAHNHQQWGSYYLDVEKDVTLKVDVKDTVCAHSEQLDYEFINRTENTLQVALQWGEKSIPFTVEVDLNKTVVESFRNELRGVNTYRWESWNDAALWCLSHNTNLEEALEWANRSINGGYYGFGANKNLVNLSTKIMLLVALNRTEELKKTVQESLEIASFGMYEAHDFARVLLEQKFDQEAVKFIENAIQKYEEAWFLKLDLALAQYYTNNHKEAIKTMKSLEKTAPDFFHKRRKEIITEMENKTYKLPNRME